MAEPFTWIAIASTLASGAVQYHGAQQNAKAQEYAADAAEAQGRYNAQIDVNNAVNATAQADFRKSAAEANKLRDLQGFQRKRVALHKKLRGELATESLRLNSSSGTFEDTFNSYNKAFETELSSFDFDASETSYGYNVQAGEAQRQRQLAWSGGLAQRDLTLSSAANQATQFRNQAKSIRTAAYGNALGSVASAASMGASLGSSPAPAPSPSGSAFSASSFNASTSSYTPFSGPTTFK